MNKSSYYITTPIYYVNDVPHIGSAYTSVAADVIARFMRLSNKEVKFLTGTDEHGQKVAKAAEKQNLSPQELTNKFSQNFRQLSEVLNLSNDDFIRTTELRHKKGVEYFWQRLIQKGNIYLGKYCGWYSLRDEAFYDESELTPSGLAPTGAAVEWLEEPSYFFALSKWQDRLLEFYEKNPNFILPSSRRNEVISFVKSGLHDLSISRTSFDWGIKVPEDQKHVIYVWLDALTNYITALGYPNQEEGYNKFWPADVHIIGKDILRFHAVYWPAFLMAAELEPPKCIFAHGWWTNEGQKISKSLGNVIDPVALVNEFGIDQVRYFLMKEVIFGNDGNYAKSALVNKINSELANKIGNLFQRTISFAYKNNNCSIPIVGTNFIQEEAYNSELLKYAEQINQHNQELMINFDLSKILDNILKLAEAANVFIDHQAPWQLKKTNPAKMLEVLYILLETLRYIATLLQPFIPTSAQKMLDQLGVDAAHRDFMHLVKEYALVPGNSISEPQAIFPKVDIAS